MVADLPVPVRRTSQVCDLVVEGGDGTTCPAGLPVPRGTVLSRHALRSFAVLVLLALLVTAANLLWTAHVVRAGNRSTCDTVLAVEAIPLPPAGAVREWAAAFEAVEQQRAAHLGCKGSP